MIRIQSFNLASDDPTWSVSGIPWNGGAGSVSGLFQSADAFISHYNLKVDTDQHTPTMADKYTFLFVPRARTSAPGHSAMAIDKTDYVTIGTNRDLRNELTHLVGIPTTSPLLVTLMPVSTTGAGLDEGTAGVHWQISRSDPEQPTQPDDLSQHILETLVDPSQILANYNSRLALPYTDAIVTYVDDLNQEIANPPAPRPIVVDYDDRINVIGQGVSSTTLEISCNSDIGNYYVDAQGVIHIVVINTIIKVY